MERSRNGSNRSRRSAASSLVAAEAPVPTWWRDVKEWTRKTVAFLFGHVGICVLVVGYIIVGAFAFMSIEKEDVNDTFMQAARERDNCVQRLWRITEQFNVLSRDNWTAAVQMEIVYYQEEIVKLVQEGYDSHNYTSDVPSTEGPSTGTQWSFSAAFLYCLTVITTIGNQCLRYLLTLPCFSELLTCFSTSSSLGSIKKWLPNPSTERSMPCVVMVILRTRIPSIEIPWQPIRLTGRQTVGRIFSLFN